MRTSRTLLAVFLTVVLIVGTGFLVTLKSVNPVVAQSDDVCLEGDGWVKVEADDPGQSPNLISYTAGENEIITKVCMKGGNEGNNEGGYKITFTSDGWHTVDGENCVGAFGIGTQSAEARRNPDISGNICSGLSHASFFIEEVTPEPTTETPEPTTETPEPTTETPEPTTETPEPTTETPEPTTETPEPTTETPEPTTETPEPTTETPEPTTETPEPSETSEPTEPPIQPDPDLGVGDWIPFIGAGLAILTIGVFLGYTQAKGKLPLKKFF